MKIKRIIDICKRSGIIEMYNGVNEQWISNGTAYYPLIGAPRYTQESLCASYDIDDKKASKMLINFHDSMPFQLMDEEAGGIMLNYDSLLSAEAIPISIYNAGKLLVPYMTKRGVEFIDLGYMSPFADMDSEMLTLAERQDAAGNTFFIVRAGFTLVGFLYPENVVTSLFVERLDMLCSQCRRTMLGNKEGEDYA